ncbi:hypothetical protein ANO11243_045390 [Dothideomycetidae sp. 11243]|nr:hypothetical protein ANO11243_045390 [fungal sp. No.11243]
METKQPPEGAKLIPLNFNDDRQVDLLAQQRDAAHYGTSSIPKWKFHAQRGERTMFWIAIPATGELGQRQTTSRQGLDIVGDDYLAVGHIALDKMDVPMPELIEPDDSVTKPDGSVLHVATLMVMPEFNRFRLGAFAVRQLEVLARQAPHGSEKCRMLTLTTVSPRHVKGGLEGPEGMDVFPKLGVPLPERSNVPWFEQLGYVQYKEALRYRGVAPDGSLHGLWCTYMRKEIQV